MVRPVSQQFCLSLPGVAQRTTHIWAVCGMPSCLGPPPNPHFRVATTCGCERKCKQAGAPGRGAVSQRRDAEMRTTEAVMIHL